MNKLLIFLFVISLLFIFQNKSQADPKIIKGLNVEAEEYVTISPGETVGSDEEKIAIYGELEIDGGNEGIILSPGQSLKHIYLDSSVTNVIVIPAEYDFGEEIEEFDKWRWRYGIYWIIFELMRYSTKTLQ